MARQSLSNILTNPHCARVGELLVCSQGSSRNRLTSTFLVCSLVSLMTAGPLAAEELGEHGFAKSGDQTIHYVAKGEGPLLICIHGFPDYWYSWRNQIPKWSTKFQVVAIDQRGYNKSSQPRGVEQYAADKLVDDVKSVMQHFGRKSATIVGHDWGGLVAWTFAMKYPQHTDHLVVLNLPHPWGLQRELATNPEQAKNSQYARNFQKPDAHKLLSPRRIAGWVQDEAARAKYIEAFERSSLEGMLNYYKANYPREPYTVPEAPPPPVQCSVLMIHGLGDQYLLASALNETWRWVEGDLTIVTVPDAAHFVQHDRPRFVTDTVFRWLTK